ncbi:MAG: serine/threonine-protein kinase, partial [Acidobacteriota bacterium]
IELLGAGGMGVVYKAEDTRLRRTVALKLLPPELSHDAVAKARFLQEARAASGLDHPNVCTVYEIGETRDGRLFLAMPWYDGETLRQRLERGPVPPAEAVEMTRQIALGLAKAHRRGIVHRDIKPANLMLTADGVVKILDFGIAKLAGSADLTRTGARIGTPTYMAPEQARGEEVDARSDLWSLGCVLREMLLGQAYPRKPTSAISPTSPMSAPRALQKILGRLLHKEPASRYPNAESLLTDLAALPDRARAYRWAAGLALALLAIAGVAVLLSRVLGDGKGEALQGTFTKLTDQPGLELMPNL